MERPELQVAKSFRLQIRSVWGRERREVMANGWTTNTKATTGANLHCCCDGVQCKLSIKLELDMTQDEG